MTASAAAAETPLQFFTMRLHNRPQERPARRVLAVSSLDPEQDRGVEPERGRRLDCARDPEHVEWVTNRHE